MNREFLLRVAASIGLAACSFTASAVTIDFENLDATSGQPVPLTAISQGGFSFVVRFNGGTSGTSGPAIFDTTCSGAACNGDEDLVPAMQGENGVSGNILILQEAGANIPDDNAGNANVVLESAPGNQPFRFIGASAVDDGDFRFRTSIDDGRLARIVLNSESETGSAQFMSGILNPGDDIVIVFRGSGGVDSLVLQPVPVPAAAWLFGTAIAGLIGFRRRRLSLAAARA